MSLPPAKQGKKKKGRTVHRLRTTQFHTCPILRRYCPKPTARREGGVGKARQTGQAQYACLQMPPNTQPIPLGPPNEKRAEENTYDTPLSLRTAAKERRSLPTTQPGQQRGCLPPTYISRPLPVCELCPDTHAFPLSSVKSSHRSPISFPAQVAFRYRQTGPRLDVSGTRNLRTRGRAGYGRRELRPPRCSRWRAIRSLRSSRVSLNSSLWPR